MRASINCVLAACVVLGLALPVSGQSTTSQVTATTSQATVPCKVPSANTQPFTAEIKITTVRTLTDGTTITRVSRMVQARDSQFRIMTLNSNVPTSVRRVANEFVIVNDPVDGIKTTWQSGNKQATVQKQPPLEQRHGCWEADSGGMHMYDDFRPPNAPAPNSAAVQPVTEDLGTMIIQGVEAHGQRITTDIPVGQIGNDGPLVSTVESWVAPSLGLTMRQVRDDPQIGRQTWELVSLSLSEPDPALFRVPEGYRVVTQELHKVPCAQLPGSAQ